MKNPQVSNGLYRRAGFYKLGGDEEDRTPGLGIANAALSQLSYIPVVKSLEWRIKSFKRRGSF